MTQPKQVGVDPDVWKEEVVRVSSRLMGPGGYRIVLSIKMYQIQLRYLYFHLTSNHT